MTYYLNYFIFHVKIKLFVTAMSEQDPDPDVHQFGSLDPDPHRGKNIDLELYRNQCGSATVIKCRIPVHNHVQGRKQTKLHEHRG
jgi:hypothetical protein